MIYIVSGFMRSGTSMMMMALEAGGLEAVYNPLRDRLIERHADDLYRPNPALYELAHEQYRVPGFPREHEAKLVKVLMDGLPRLVAGAYKIAFMRRDFEEIRQSYQAFFDRSMPMDRVELRMRDILGICRVRTDMEVTELRYRDVIEDPLSAFGRLVLAGWPIEPKKAAAIVRPEYCRFRREALQVGA